MIEKEKTLDNYMGIKVKINKNIEKFKNSIDLIDYSNEDWTFKTANTKEFSHAIFNDYPARMIPQISRRLISKYYPKYKDPKKKKPLLDPFGGSGTSCVEALLRNIDSIAFDLNPLANLIEKSKTLIIKPVILKNKYTKIKKLIETNKTNIFPKYIPEKQNLRYWFNENVIKDLTIIRNSIEVAFTNDIVGLREELTDAKGIFLICYGKTARNCSYQRRGEHKNYRIKKEKIPEFDKNINTISNFYEITESYLSAQKELYDYYTYQNFNAKCSAILGNSMKLEGIKNNSIDLIVTSPPYGDSQTTVAYGQFSKIPLEWIFLDLGEINQIDNKLLGGKKQNHKTLRSSTLFETCKQILKEEFSQQNKNLEEALKPIDQIVIENFKKNNPAQKLKLVDEIKNNFDEIQKFEIELDEITDFDSLVDIKEDYYDLAKKIRTTSHKVNNWLKENGIDLKVKIKILDERLPYVLSFFFDFFQVFKRLYQVLDYNRKCCIVIGNRTVKRVSIPTDKIIIEMGKSIGFEHLKNFYREIPNKRMPKRNSPTNVKGIQLTTILGETIIIFSKPKQIVN